MIRHFILSSIQNIFEIPPYANQQGTRDFKVQDKMWKFYICAWNIMIEFHDALFAIVYKMSWWTPPFVVCIDHQPFIGWSQGSESFSRIKKAQLTTWLLRI